MFDTVNAHTSIYIDESELEEKGWLKCKSRKTFVTCFVYCTGLIRVFYLPVSRQVHVEFSCPKLLYGNNIEMAYEEDLERISNLVRQVLAEIIGEQVNALPGFKYWEVSRIDYCYNFKVNESDKARYIDIFNKSYISRCKSIEYETTAFYYNKSKRFEIYSKVDEIINSDDYDEILCQYEDIGAILRVEKQFRRRSIKRMYGEKSKVQDLFSNHIAEKSISDMFDEMKISRRMVSKEEIFNRIDSIYSRRHSRTLKGFIEFVNDNSLGLAKENYAESSFYKYQKQVLELGTGLFYQHEDIIDKDFEFKIEANREKVLSESCVAGANNGDLGERLTIIGGDCEEEGIEKMDKKVSLFCLYFEGIKIGKEGVFKTASYYYDDDG
jgi:hypothetical protein